MKYLLINGVSGYGSTGRIAADTCRSLIARGHECRIAYGRWDLGCSDQPEIRIGTNWNRRIHGVQTRILDNHGFASGIATARFLKQVREYDPDVILLHNLHGYYLHVGMLFDYLKTSGKEIHWMLHDCWAFTGHCSHFTYVGCDRWKTGCHHCPQKGEYPESILLDASLRNYEKKRAAFTGVPNLTITVPSHWLEGLVKQSFLREYPVEVRYHTVDTDAFRPTPSDLKERLGIGQKKMILSVSGVWDERKGMKDLLALPDYLEDDCRLVLLGLTEEQLRNLPGNIIGLPKTASVRALAEAYTAADVYVTASYEETFGMTILEAASCGTSAVAYRGTACREVAEFCGGIAVSPGPEHLAAGIRQLLAAGKGNAL